MLGDPKVYAYFVNLWVFSALSGSKKSPWKFDIVGLFVKKEIRGFLMVKKV